MQRAQHLLSPLSHRAADHYDSEQQDSPRQVNPILTFGNKVVRVKPMASLACGTTHKSKFEFPTLPHRVMVAWEPFNDDGKFVLPLSLVWVLFKKPSF
jgi:cell division cycle protein 20 (cofactor of APC complex)